MEDAPDDRDVKVQKYSGYWFNEFKSLLPVLLHEDASSITLAQLAESGETSREVRRTLTVDEVEKTVFLLEPFQEAPQLLDPHLASILTPITSAFLAYLLSEPDEGELPKNTQTLPEGIARLLYTLCKIRGWKVVSRFFPNEPHLLQAIVSRLKFEGSENGEEGDPLEKSISRSWELRYVLLLWLAHLMLTPFDLSSISAPESKMVHDRKNGFIPSSSHPLPEQLISLPPLSKTLLLLGTKFIFSPSPRESDAAALLLVRLASRKDMLVLGVLDCVVSWCLDCLTNGEIANAELRSLGEGGINPLFACLGALKVLAGIVTQESKLVRKFIQQIWEVITGLEDRYSGDTNMEDGESTSGGKASGKEWDNAGVRKIGTKIYRSICTILLTPTDLVLPESADSNTIIEDIIGRLLNLLGDRDTNVRLGASKSLGVLTSKLPTEMASEVIQAIIDGFEEDVLYENEPSTHSQSFISLFHPENIKITTPMRRQVLASVSPERWHGLTLTLATLLRQRAIKPLLDHSDDSGINNGHLFQTITHRILTALSFEQRRTTFAVGSNVRDAANYAAWSLARSYSTKELLAFPPPEIEFLTTGSQRNVNVPQLLATHLIIAGCLDPLGNIRRGASAALQELVGRHPDIVIEGIKVVQNVDYGGVSVRRRAVIEVSSAAAVLDQGYWEEIVNGLINGWRGIGAADAEGRRIAARGLGKLVTVRFKQGDSDEKVIRRGKLVIGHLLHRWKRENKRDVEVRHGILWALAEVLEGIASVTNGFTNPDAGNPIYHYDDIFTEKQLNAIFRILSSVQGRDFINPILRPELFCEASCRFSSALCRVSRNTLASLPSPTITILSTIAHSAQRIALAIIETCLDYRTEDAVLEQAIPAAKELFKVLSRRNRTRIVETWCRRILNENKSAIAQLDKPGVGSGRSGLGRKRGLVSGLGEVIAVLIAEENAGGSEGWEDYEDENDDETMTRENGIASRRTKKVNVVDDVVSVLVSAATRRGDVEMRVAGIRGITRGIMGPSTPSSFSIARFPEVIHALYDALDDYAVDTRGDVGSWVRTDAISAVLEGWKNNVLRFDVDIPSPYGKEKIDIMTGFVKRLIRLSVEKLDKLRVKAFECLRHILLDSNSSPLNDISNLATLIDFSQPSSIYTTATSTLYFSCLLPLLQSAFVRKDLLTGFVTSSGAGTESLLRTSAMALFTYLDSFSTSPVQLIPIYDGFLQVLKESLEGKNDRILIPTLETIGWCIEMNVLFPFAQNDLKFDTKTLFLSVQKAHLKTGSVGKLIASLRVYRALLVHFEFAGANGNPAGTRGLVIRKLVAMLSHPFPKVRKEVSESLYIGLMVRGVKEEVEEREIEAASELESVDWMGDVKGLKGVVEKIRGLLVGGGGAGK